MTQAFEIAGLGLAAQQQALDIVANNVANLNTPAFKRSDVRFSEIVTRQADLDNPAANLETRLSMAGVRVQPVMTLDTPGQLEQTGNALDVAIDGNGFIELLGPNGQILLWRGGSLRVLEDGALATEGELPLRALISVPLNASELRIGADGMVTARSADSAEVLELGQIRLVRLDDPSVVERMDGGIYRPTSHASLVEMTPNEDGAGALIQGSIERSNVEINNEMIRLMIVQRAYTANAQIVQAADQLMSIANNLRR